MILVHDLTVIIGDSIGYRLDTVFDRSIISVGIDNECSFVDSHQISSCGRWLSFSNGLVRDTRPTRQVNY